MLNRDYAKYNPTSRSICTSCQSDEEALLSKPVRVLQYGSVVGGGGVGAFLINLYREIDKSRVQFDFLHHLTDAGVDKETMDEIKALGGRVYGIPQLRRSPVEARRQIKEVITTADVDILHCNMTLLTQLIPVKVAAGLGKPVIMHSHSANRKFEKSFLRNILSGDFHAAADNITFYTDKINRKKIENFKCEYFACSRAAGAAMFGENAVNGGKVTVLPNAIKAESFTYQKEKACGIRSKMKLDGKFVIGHIGRFEFEKNHDFIVEVFAEVRKKCSDAVLMLVGDGIRKAEIEAKVRDMGLSEAVMFMGNRSDVPDLLQAMDVFLFPSVYEGLGIVAIEAQAAGMPVIASEEVPKDAKLTGLMEYISLKESLGVWAEAVLKHRNGQRCDTYAEIVKAGYDVKDTAAMMADYYCGMVKK